MKLLALGQSYSPHNPLIKSPILISKKKRLGLMTSNLLSFLKSDNSLIIKYQQQILPKTWLNSDCIFQPYCQTIIQAHSFFDPNISCSMFLLNHDPSRFSPPTYPPHGCMMLSNSKFYDIFLFLLLLPADYWTKFSLFSLDTQILSSAHNIQSQTTSFPVL